MGNLMYKYQAGFIISIMKFSGLFTGKNLILGLVLLGGGVVALKALSPSTPKPSVRAVNKMVTGGGGSVEVGSIVQNDDIPVYDLGTGYDYAYNDTYTGGGMMPTVANMEGNVKTPSVMNAYYSKMQRLSI